jgi:hypothetical protein
LFHPDLDEIRSSFFIEISSGEKGSPDIDYEKRAPLSRLYGPPVPALQGCYYSHSILNEEGR